MASTSGGDTEMKCISGKLHNFLQSDLDMHLWDVMGPRGNIIRSQLRKHLSRAIRNSTSNLENSLIVQIKSDLDAAN
jgi:hypothetical protein